MDQAGAWAAGAEGERRVAAALDGLPAAWTVVHDRLLRPGRSEANLDHVVVGPGGVLLVDAKNRAGRVTEHDGGLFQHRVRDGRRETVSLAGELKKVHGMAAYMAAESDLAVTPVICLAGSQEGEFGAPRMVRGVWVVPLSALNGWIGYRPALLRPEEVASAVTRVLTDFPSTTTDPDLLSAMGKAAEAGHARQRSGRGGRPPRSSAHHAAGPGRSGPRPRKHGAMRTLGSLLALMAATALFLGVLERLPSLVPAGPERSADGDSSTITPSGTSSTTGARVATATKRPVAPTKPAGDTKKPAQTKVTARAAVPKPLGPPDCATATASQIKAIIKRSVQPVAVSTGCAWGTRLDDESTVLVTIVMTPDHAPYDTALATSAKQRRVVFGTSLDSTFLPATKASVARGRPVTRGSSGIKARADTVVVVSTRKLGISDDRGRQLAVAIAAAANFGG